MITLSDAAAKNAEGIIVESCQSFFWHGNEWSEDLPISDHFGPFDTEEAAKKWARAHDPEDWEGLYCD